MEFVGHIVCVTTTCPAVIASRSRGQEMSDERGSVSRELDLWTLKL